MILTEQEWRKFGENPDGSVAMQKVLFFLSFALRAKDTNKSTFHDSYTPMPHPSRTHRIKAQSNVENGCHLAVDDRLKEQRHAQPLRLRQLPSPTVHRQKLRREQRRFRRRRFEFDGRSSSTKSYVLS